MDTIRRMNSGLPRRAIAAWLLLAALIPVAKGFTSLQQQHRSHRQQLWITDSFQSLIPILSSASALAAASNDDVGVWESLLPEPEKGSVRKSVIVAAPDDADAPPLPGSKVTIAYTASLWMTDDDDENCGASIAAWDTQAVIGCWLSEQQGLAEVLAEPFSENDIDGSTLLDEELFTEDFVKDTLGVAKPIQCKKTMMSLRRLRSTFQDYEHGTVVDSRSEDEGGYEFVLGAGKTIKAMELLVATMAAGETSRVVARCDYGYGSDGLRTAKGDVLVPPFCGLQFEVTLLSVTSQP